MEKNSLLFNTILAKWHSLICPPIVRCRVRACPYQVVPDRNQVKTCEYLHLPITQEKKSGKANIQISLLLSEMSSFKVVNLTVGTNNDWGITKKYLGLNFTAQIKLNCLAWLGATNFGKIQGYILFGFSTKITNL